MSSPLCFVPPSSLSPGLSVRVYRRGSAFSGGYRAGMLVCVLAAVVANAGLGPPPDPGESPVSALVDVPSAPSDDLPSRVLGPIPVFREMTEAERAKMERLSWPYWAEVAPAASADASVPAVARLSTAYAALGEQYHAVERGLIEMANRLSRAEARLDAFSGGPDDAAPKFAARVTPGPALAPGGPDDAAPKFAVRVTPGPALAPGGPDDAAPKFAVRIDPDGPMLPIAANVAPVPGPALASGGPMEPVAANVAPAPVLADAGGMDNPKEPAPAEALSSATSEPLSSGSA